MSDALSDYKPKGDGIYLRFSADRPVRLRVLTTDPLVSLSKWGTTRFSFVVYNFDEDRAQVLQCGASILKRLQEIHTDEDFPELDSQDIKITAEGQGIDTRYTVSTPPRSTVMTQEMVEKAKKIDLVKAVPGGIRLSAHNHGEPLNGQPQEGIDEEADYETETQVGEDPEETDA